MFRPSISHAVVLFLSLSVAGCDDSDYSALYKADDKAPSLSQDAIEKLEHLGPTIVDKGVNFGVYSERATRIELLVFEDPESTQPTRQFPMKRFGDVWNIHIEGLGVGTHYGYIAWGPNWTYDPEWHCGRINGFVADVDNQGNRFNPNKLLTDPYAKAVSRDHDWSKGSIASGPRRADCTFAAASKSVVINSQYAWGAAEAEWRQNRQNPDMPGHQYNDLILYEVHVKGYTANTGSRVDHPGTYRGFAEKADYLKELGITAVELLPVHEKPTDGGYWGYQTINFFAPELSYSSRQEWRFVTDEFKYMVEELHKRGIEVIVDVVYNHTGEGGLWREKIEQDVSPDEGIISVLSNYDPEEVAGLYSFRGLDNNAYYALDKSGKTYWNNTGVGNQTRTNHKPFRKLILDSLRYYVEELHVDGFRFDLAPVLGTADDDFNAWLPNKDSVLQEIIDDPVLKKHNTRIIAEPWVIGGCVNGYDANGNCQGGNPMGWFPQNSTDKAFAWSEWNGHFRDIWREFLNFDVGLSKREGPVDLGGSLTGSFDLYGKLANKPVHAQTERKPYNSVNFITVHDGFTLYDLFAYKESVNNCGPLNPICCDSPNSPFCERKDNQGWGNGYRSREWAAPLDLSNGVRLQMMRNAFAVLMLAHGTPMILGGDEWARTQLGNSNAYTTWSDNAFNWFDWGVWETQDWRYRLKDFVAQTIRLRKKYKHAFAPLEYAGAQNASFVWLGADGKPAVGDTWQGRTMMMHYNDTSKGPELLVIINGADESVNFTLPAGKTWRRVLDTQLNFDDESYVDKEGLDNRKTANVTLDSPVPVAGPTYGAMFRSIVVLEAGSSR